MSAHSESAERILQQADELFRLYGPTKTSVADIAHKLRMSPANIYRSFPTKQLLIEATYRRRLTILIENILEFTRSKENSWWHIEKLFSVVHKHFCMLILNKIDYFEIYAAQHGLIIGSGDMSGRWAFYVEFHNFIRDELRYLIEAGISRGEMEVDDPAEAASGLFDCLIAAVDPALIVLNAPEEGSRKLHRQLALLSRAFLPRAAGFPPPRAAIV